MKIADGVTIAKCEARRAADHTGEIYLPTREGRSIVCWDVDDEVLPVNNASVHQFLVHMLGSPVVGCDNLRCLGIVTGHGHGIVKDDTLEIESK
jgi:hypothetical protein